MGVDRPGLYLAVPRPVFRGLRPWISKTFRPSTIHLQCRDPFSGDCDAVLSRADAFACAGVLQCRDPFSGDCDVEGDPSLHHIDARHLQCRDPFSGDCDARNAHHVLPATRSILQCRDPFSGDCDNNRRPIGRLTVSSDLQCRDPFSGDCDIVLLELKFPDPSHSLAVPRPVFRGLRHPDQWAPRDGVDRRPCSAETRFQGIATLAILVGPDACNLSSCSAETRFQGIATVFSVAAESLWRRIFLQCRDPFSGDCDRDSPV